jgi:hypothetical protein
MFPQARTSLCIALTAGVAFSCAAEHSDAADAADEPKQRPSKPSSDAMPVVLAPPDKLAVLAGPLDVPAPGQENIAFYGTDLGVSFEHGDEIRILFGDTWSDSGGSLIGTVSDDAQGAISMRSEDGFPDGDAVDAFIAAQPLADGAPWWTRAAPPVTMHVVDGKAAPFELYRGGFHGQAPINMSIGRAVVAGFSNGRDGAFTILRRDVPIACAPAGAAPCADGFECDAGLGVCSNSDPEYPTTCVIGSDDRCGTGATCNAIAGGGFCQDRTSSLYAADDEFGRLEAVAIEQEIGCADPDQPARYFTQPWVTNKFTNPIAKTVADFDPARDDPDANDYRPADGSHPAREKVLVWGRPHTCGTSATGRQASVYFAYADMPEYSASGDFTWQLHYLSGFTDDRPVFSDAQTDAIELDLSGEPDPRSEPFDIVDRTAVTYLQALHVWVMFYGGDFAAPVLSVFEGANYTRVVRDPRGAIHARFAEHPWGPWSAPVPALEAGNGDVSPPEPDSEYTSLGMLHHAACSGAHCIPGENAISHVFTPYGFLYGPNIFDAWTAVREDGRAVDVYWNVSTWNPYQTVLLRTRIRR